MGLDWMACLDGLDFMAGHFLLARSSGEVL
jgi:hypothetical protein